MTDSPPDPVWDNGVPRCVKYQNANCPHYDGKRCGLLGHQPHDICEPMVKEMHTQLGRQQHQSVVTDRDMNTQMYATMRALEKAAEVVIDHFTADKQPPTQNCACGDPTKPGPHRPTGICGCPSCHGGDDTAPCLCDEHSEHVFDGDVRVKGDLTVEGRTTTVESDIEMLKLREADVADIQNQLKAHRQALAIIARFGAFGGASFGLPDPQEQVARKIDLKACDCVGTGWLARDESCKGCGGRGYVSP
jgi:hypothetical protein